MYKRVAHKLVERHTIVLLALAQSPRIDGHGAVRKLVGGEAEGFFDCIQQFDAVEHL